MFSDTLTITVNTVAVVLNRINQDGYSSEYLKREATQEYRLRIRNSTSMNKTRGREVSRHNVEFTQTVYPVAPSTAATVRKAYFVFENDNVDDLTGPVKHALGTAGFLTEPNLTKLVNFES